MALVLLHVPAAACQNAELQDFEGEHVAGLFVSAGADSLPAASGCHQGQMRWHLHWQ